MTATQSDINCKSSDDYLILAIDIGNSRIKMLPHFAEQVYPLEISDDFRTQFESTFDNYFAEFKAHKTIVFISSVNSKAKDIIESILKSKHITFINVAGLIKTQDKVSLDSVQGMGQDRVLGLFGALKTNKPPIITVDFGTCTTINALDKNFSILGGAIMPGLLTQMKSLEESTSALKTTEIFFEKDWCGNDTDKAIRVGIINGSFCAVKGIVENIIRDYFNNETPVIVFTGGMAHIASEAKFDWGFSFVIDESLNLKGILNLAKI